MKSNIPI